MNLLGEDVTCNPKSLLPVATTNRITKMEVWYSVFTGVSKLTLFTANSAVSET